MPSYEPNPTVVFGGVTQYSSNNLSNININLGRQSITDQPQPGYAKIELWTSSDDPLEAITLSTAVQVYIDKGTSGTQQIFEGIVSDIDITLEAFGNQGSIAKYSLTCVGPLAQLQKRLVGLSGYAKEFDGTRVYNILTEAYLTNWYDVAPTLTWSRLPTTTTWASYDATAISLVNALASTVDRPGQYELAAYTSGEGNAYDIAGLAAQSGRGVLYEAGNGGLYYDDYAARALNTPTITLTGNDILTAGLRTSAQWSEIVNDVNLTWKSGTVTARDEQSIILYGQLAGSRNTQLENSTDASNQASSFLETRSYPRVYPEGYTIPLHSPNVTDATRDALVGTYCGMPINTTALPAVFGTTFEGFVEGWSWNLTRYTAFLNLICSSLQENYPHKTWFQISPTVTWAGYTPITTKWQDL
jgi:hypothetical protein